MEYEMTGFLGGTFESQTTNGPVLNFYLKNGGYFDPDKKEFVDYEYPIEAWLKELMDKIKKIPRGSVISVRFTLVPRRLPVGEKRILVPIMKASSVTYWDQQKGDKKRGTDGNQMFIDFPLFTEG